MDEKEYFNDGNVVITNNRILTQGHTYVLSKISSVSMGTIKSTMVGCIKWFTLLSGIFVTIIGVGGLGNGFGYFLILGLILIGVGILGFVQYPKFTIYSVRLGGELLEEDIIKSNDQQYILKIIDAINEAVKNQS